MEWGRELPRRRNTFCGKARGTTRRGGPPPCPGLARLVGNPQPADLDCQSRFPSLHPPPEIVDNAVTKRHAACDSHACCSCPPLDEPCSNSARLTISSTRHWPTTRAYSCRSRKARASPFSARSRAILLSMSCSHSHSRCTSSSLARNRTDSRTDAWESSPAQLS